MKAWASLIIAAISIAAPASAADLEEIYVLRSIREPHAPTEGWCDRSRTGFEPMPAEAERFFSFWSVRSQPESGRVIDAKAVRVGELRGCFGSTDDRARQNFYVEVQLGAITFHGRGDCLALMIDVPEPGLFPVRCQVVLGSLAAPFAGGLLTTSTMTTKASVGGDSDPPGYTQASIATIRLWRAR